MHYRCIYRYREGKKHKFFEIKKIKIYDIKYGDVIFDGGWIYYNGYNYMKFMLSSSSHKYIFTSSHDIYSMRFCKKNKMIEYINVDYKKTKNFDINLNPSKILIQFTDTGWIDFINEFKRSVLINCRKK